jgi:methionyl-tRNA formyltransferase
MNIPRPTLPPFRAVVFAYHNVGVRCLQVLLAHGVDVQLVVTHTDNPTETIWFDSVERVATVNRLPCATPIDPNTAEWIDHIRALQPDFIFSFYYRHMLNTELLSAARLGAYNMHGSLLPKYRGRVPVNWAIIHGERHTGATLHRMVAKPDAGEMVAQQAVPILPDDTAHDVFQKVTVAAELALDAALPSLLAGTAIHKPLDLDQGSYFGGRKAEDGRIDWTQPAQRVHNLIRAVAPPYPGAFADVQGKHLRILRSRCETALHAHTRPKSLFADGSRLLAACGDGRILELLDVEHAGQPVDAAAFIRLFGAVSVPAC